jgi:hypothetical protein
MVIGWNGVVAVIALGGFACKIAGDVFTNDIVYHAYPTQPFVGESTAEK